MEHRYGERRRIGAAVLVRRPDWAGWMVAELKDLSVSGAFIAAPAGLFPRRSQVQVEARSPEGMCLQCRAMVVRHTAAGFGLLFDGLRVRASQGPKVTTRRGALLRRPVCP